MLQESTCRKSTRRGTVDEDFMVLTSEEFVKLTLGNPGEVIIRVIVTFYGQFRKTAPVVSMEEVRSNSQQMSIIV